MHRLSASFVLGYHGCQRPVGERILSGTGFTESDNPFDWLGPGVYFWEANPRRGLEFAREQAARKGQDIREAFVVGGIIDLGLCLDLTTSIGIGAVRSAYKNFVKYASRLRVQLPQNSTDLLRRNLDCAVIRRLHTLIGDAGGEPIQTVKGIFTEGKPIYPNAGFYEKTHVQVAVRDRRCIKGVFRVPPHHLT